ncbi:hypothetical protein GCM10010195_35090 [Kitasatospora griseola]|nr:hypothetical protein GCM10010195_35090 [Kitasatospora griseola]
MYDSRSACRKQVGDGAAGAGAPEAGSAASKTALPERWCSAATASTAMIHGETALTLEHGSDGPHVSPARPPGVRSAGRTGRCER